jgi:WD40 repeat protein
VLEGHTGAIYIVAITSDDKYVVSRSSDRTVRVWDLKDKTEKAVLKVHNDSVLSIAITSDCKHLFSGSRTKR